MHRPLISVVIPVFNEEGKIARAIKSIQDQTYTHLEILVIDDFSTDNTQNIVKKIASEDPRVTYHTSPYRLRNQHNWRGYNINAGCVARSYGFSLAKGEWITTQDADDASLLNRIEVQYTLATKYNATMLTIQWRKLEPSLVGKRLDVERLFRDFGEETFLIRPESINKLPEENLGILMRLPFYHKIPFTFKWFPYTRKLFYGKRTSFPGADNSMLFRREVIERGVNFRERDARQWGSPTGRGSGRDFVMHVTQVFRNTWSFMLPLYLWEVRSDNTEIPPYDEYLI